MYQLGLNLEPRYKSLKPADGIYTQNTANHVTSSVRRARMSGVSMLAAFYKPNFVERILPIDWQPVPLHVLPIEEDCVSRPRV